MLARSERACGVVSGWGGMIIQMNDEQSCQAVEIEYISECEGYSFQSIFSMWNRSSE